MSISETELNKETFNFINKYTVSKNQETAGSSNAVELNTVPGPSNTRHLILVILLIPFMTLGRLPGLSFSSPPLYSRVGDAQECWSQFPGTNYRTFGLALADAVLLTRSSVQ